MYTEPWQTEKTMTHWILSQTIWIHSCRWLYHTEIWKKIHLQSKPNRSVQDDIYVLGKAHMHSTLSLSLPNVAFETVPMLIRLTKQQTKKQNKKKQTRKAIQEYINKWLSQQSTEFATSSGSYWTSVRMPAASRSLVTLSRSFFMELWPTVHTITSHGLGACNWTRRKNSVPLFLNTHVWTVRMTLVNLV